ncbi:MAG: DUF1573 domain-containing protein [Planctomycetaceae bacterium]|nr:DUF1573 domain-containing protein [Planctomycetaceae bacterium]
MKYLEINNLYLIIIIVLFHIPTLVAGENNDEIHVDQENLTLREKNQISVGDMRNIVSLPDGRFIINTLNSKRIYAIQCGLDVTVFTLKYFKLDYSLTNVSIGLPLSNNGISMKDIKQMLQCHGLKIEARQNITLNNIIQKINHERIAILPMQMGNGFSHYFVIMSNDKGEIILVNVLRGVSLLKDTQFEKNIKKYNKLFIDAGGVVLFVKKDKDKTVSISKTVKLNPDTIELGEFMIGGPGSSSLINTSFDLINTSDSPIMVSSIQTTCGCTKLEWEGGILKAGEKKEVKFSVIPGAWGRGEQKKIARVSFADGSTKEVTIHGTGQPPVERQRIELSQYSAIIEINDETNTEFFDVRLARLSSYVRPIQEIKMTSDVSWLKPELIDQEKM